MNRIAGLLLLPMLASCDFMYSVRRSTSIDSRLDPAELGQWAQQQAGYNIDEAFPWDGTEAFHPFEREQASAYVCLCGGELEVYSGRIGPPTDDELDGWLVLQTELINALRVQFPFLPPEQSWQMTSTYLEAQLAAAADRASRGS